jgi:protein SCO1/2
MASGVEPLPNRIEQAAIRWTGRASFWVVLVGLLAGFQIVRALTAKIPEPPKVLLELPAFTLTDQVGKPFGSKDLEGKIWVADFMFTSCPTMCPTLTKQMQKVRHRLRNMGDAVHLVSFSVDPDHDTPEKLKEYALKYGANPESWSFLTGPLKDVEDAVVKGFKMPMDRDGKDNPGIFDITHGSRFVLLDTRGKIRGYYDSSDEGVDQLVRDVGLVAAAEITAPR